MRSASRLEASEPFAAFGVVRGVECFLCGHSFLEQMVESERR
jgi:hypothetical protein